MHSSHAIPVQRGCGSRIRGGIYAEVGTGPGGRPIEFFLIDPPELVDFRRLGVTPVGVKLIERAGVHHVIDYIGSEHYPDVASFIEEARRFGISRRLPRNLDFAKLTPDSRLIFAHARAYIENFDAYARQWAFLSEEARAASLRCPLGKPAHNQVEPPAFCVGAFWQDIEPPIAPESSRRVVVQMPAFNYEAFARPADITPRYLPALFLSVPISRLVAVNKDARTDQSNRQRIASSKLPTDIVGE